MISMLTCRYFHSSFFLLYDRTPNLSFSFHASVKFVTTCNKVAFRSSQVQIHAIDAILNEKESVIVEVSVFLFTVCNHKLVE